MTRPRSKPAQPRECSIADTLALVGERWTLLTIRELSLGVRRFDAIVRNTGASRETLTYRLRKLQAAGIVRRELYGDSPERYEYHLTEAGTELSDVLLTLMKWGDKFLHHGDPPVRWRHSCGKVLHPVLVCRSCGELAREGSHSPEGRGVLNRDTLRTARTRGRG